MEQKNPYKKIIIILTIVAVALGGLFTYQYVEKSALIDEITVEKENVQRELNTLVLNYDTLQTDNRELQVKLEKEQERIKLLAEKMRVFRNNSYAELNRYKDEVNTLKQVLRSYVVQIDSLNRKNQELSAENSKVKKQITWVKDQNNELNKANEKLNNIVSRAKMLEAKDVKVLTLNDKGRIKTKAKKITKLKTTFKLAKNVTAVKGKKTIYIRIVRPNQTLILDFKENLFKFRNKLIGYSAKRTIDYEGEELEVAIFWTNDKSLTKGNYKVDIFAEGEHIGKGTFFIKK